ncbi:MAG: hypothetical protein JWP63_6866 [Candidatus Solibacter sp.]|nr:hypothetical protein [Candidatus Solibacter sp.]
MTRLRNLSFTLFAGSALLLAQTPQTGGWRRAGDPPPAPEPAPVAQNRPGDPGVMDQDPTQPVARADAYGQPQQDGAPSMQQQPMQHQPMQQQPMQPGMQPGIRNERPMAAVPRYGLPASVTIRPGTFVTVRLNQALSSDHNQEGDIFSATLAQPMVVDGVVVAARGQTVMGRVAEAVRVRGHGNSRLALQLTAITLADGTQVSVQSQLVNRTGGSNLGTQVGTVATTTAIGAAVGAAADWGRGAAIGAGAGAAAGVIGALLTPGKPTVVYPEQLLTFRVDTPVTVDLTRASTAFRYVSPDEYDRPMQQMAVQRRPAPAPYYAAPYPYYYGGPGYYPYSSWWGPSFGFGVVIRGGGYRRWR